jgi:hypothetical protein
MRGKFLQIQEDLFAIERQVCRKIRPRPRKSSASIWTSYRESVRFFESSCELQDAALFKVRTENLHADR